MSLHHRFVGTNPDGPDTTKVRTTNWNDEHIFTGGAQGSLLARATGVDGGADWIASAAGVLASTGVGQVPAFRALVAGDIPALPYALASRTVNGQALTGDITITNIAGNAATATFATSAGSATTATSASTATLAAAATVLATPRAIYGNNFDGSAALAQTIAVGFGGTGHASYAIGDLLYANTISTLARLADVAVGSVLVSGGLNTAPAWSSSPVVTSLVLPNGATIAQTATAQFSFSGTYSPTGQGRGIYYAPTLNTETGGAMLAVGLYPTISVVNGVVTTSINNLELRPTFTGTPSSLAYAVNLSVVDFVAPTNTIEACTVRIDNEPTGATRNWALLVGDGKNYFGGKYGHQFGNGTTDSATQILFRTTADTVSRRGAWFDGSLAGLGNGDFGAIVLVNGTLTEPASGAANGAGLRIDGVTIVAAGGAFTTVSSLYIASPPAASGASNYSLFIDAGVARFDGQVQVAQGSASAPSIADQTATTRGVNFGNNQIELINGGATKALLDNTGAVLEWRLGSASSFSMSSNANPSAAGADTFLRRSAAGVWGASTNGTTNAGKFNAAGYQVAGTDGFTGSGTFTTFTITGGLVMAAA